MMLEQNFRGFLRPAALFVALALPGIPALALDASRPPPQTAAAEIPESRITSAIERLDGLSENLLEVTGIPGLAVAVVWRGETVYANGFGLRRVGEAAKVDADTVFQIASLSKPVAATVVARQVGEGLVGWDTPVADHLPWFRLADPWVSEHVTIGDLFAHRSGLPDHAGDDLEDLGYDRRQVLERLRYQPLAPFRAHYAYTNFGLTAAAEAVAQASRTDWASLSQDAIYGPLGMDATSSRHTDYLARKNRASGHIRISERFVSGDQRQPDAQSPAGGVSASVSDFARWMIMVLGRGETGGRRIVEEKALLQAVTGKMVSSPAYAPDARASYYGYGFGVSTQPSGRVVLSHSGAFYLGNATTFMLLPSEELGIVVFSNGTPIGAVEALAAQFMDLVQFGEITRDWVPGFSALIAPLTAPLGELVGSEPPENPTPSGELPLYGGQYQNDYFGDAKVVADKDGLVLRLGPDSQTYRLKHWDGDRFVFPMFGENAPEGSLSAAIFDRDGGGPARSLTIELLDENGLGTFFRPGG